MKRLLTFFLLLFGGCAPARIVKEHGMSLSANAPVNERESRGGTVKYKVERFSLIPTTDKRDAAYVLMHDSCKGDYRITNEAITPMIDPDSGNAVDFVYLDYECTEASK